MRICLLIAWIVSISINQQAIAQSGSHLAYWDLDQDWQSPVSPDERGACVFDGTYQNGRFVKHPKLSERKPDYDLIANDVLKAFPANASLTGVDSVGHLARARVARTDPDAISDLGGITLWVRSETNPPLGDIALVATSSIPIQVLRTASVRIDPSTDAVLRKRAAELWKKHLPERSPDERPARFTLKTPTASRVQGVPGILIVSYPMDIEEENLNGDGKIDHDDRGIMFFIYSQQNRKIIRGVFGHPEWSPGSTVWTIKPELFFRVGGGVFFIGVSDGGWESIGHGLFNLESGQQILSCF